MLYSGIRSNRNMQTIRRTGAFSIRRVSEYYTNRDFSVSATPSADACITLSTASDWRSFIPTGPCLTQCGKPLEEDSGPGLNSRNHSTPCPWLSTVSQCVDLPFVFFADLSRIFRFRYSPLLPLTFIHWFSSLGQPFVLPANSGRGRHREISCILASSFQMLQGTATTSPWILIHLH